MNSPTSFASTGPRCARCWCSPSSPASPTRCSSGWSPSCPACSDKANGSIIEVGRKAGRQQPDRPVVHRHRRQPAAAVLPEPAVGGRRRLRPAGHQRQQPRPGEHRRHPGRPVAARRTTTASRPACSPWCARAAPPSAQLEGVDGVASVLHRRRCRRGAVGDRPARRARQRRPPDQGGQRQRAVRDHAARRSSTPTKACGSSAPSSARTTRSARSCRSAARAPADPAVPADAVTASGSGLDPHISLAYADLQVEPRRQGPRRQRRTRSGTAVADNTDGRDLGFMGEPTGQRAAAQPRTGPEVPGEELTPGG